MSFYDKFYLDFFNGERSDNDDYKTENGPFEVAPARTQKLLRLAAR